MRRILFPVLALTASAQAAVAQLAPATPWPAYVQASILENKGGKAPESLYEKPVGVNTLREVANSIRGMPRFPDYLYSGCHDRAHAAYMLLPDSLRVNSMKIWVFAPQRFAPGISGTITLGEIPSRTTESGARWGYHVALAFKDSAQALHIYDPALAPDRLISREEWFSFMNIPQLSFWTVVPGWVYSFTSIPVTDTSVLPRSDGVFSGGFFMYNGTAAQEGWIPRALARDAVGQSVASSDTCPELERLLMNPGEMQRRLHARDLPPDCARQVELFDRELQRWTRLLDHR